jgi:hypothetical protein
MKKIFTLGILSLCLMSCESEDVCYQNNCGLVVSTSVKLNFVTSGDEEYQIIIKTECDKFETVWIPFNIDNGLPGSPNQAVQKVIVGQYYCK